ncbi:MAG: class D beta-lactamase [Cytophagaceae bacterium]
MLRILFLFVLILIITSSTHKPQGSSKGYSAYIQKVLDSLHLNGTMVIWDGTSREVWSNNFKRAKTGFLPASTFKIPNSIIGLETGIIISDTFTFHWDGKARFNKIWEKDMQLREAFQISCVPCYQELAREIGPERMKSWLHQLKFGNMVVDSATIDMFWLEGNSRITPMEEIDFMMRLVHQTLPLKPSTYQTMHEIMRMDDISDLNVYGKSGWAIQNYTDIGWFVGYVEKEGRYYYFATNVSPQDDFDMTQFPSIRRIITYQVLRKVVR